MLTIALCTWNRSKVLEKALHAFTQLVRPAGLHWEVVVVDNNSTDDTGDVLAAFQGRLPLRPVCEPTPGASHARNRAVSEARGEAMLWTDDDAVVDPGWMTSYAQALAANPGVALFGGPIEPLFEVPPPAWLVGGWDSVAGALCHQGSGTCSDRPRLGSCALRAELRSPDRGAPAVSIRHDTGANPGWEHPRGGNRAHSCGPRCRSPRPVGAGRPSETSGASLQTDGQLPATLLRRVGVDRGTGIGAVARSSAVRIPSLAVAARGDEGSHLPMAPAHAAGTQLGAGHDGGVGCLGHAQGRGAPVIAPGPAASAVLAVWPGVESHKYLQLFHQALRRKGVAWFDGTWPLTDQGRARGSQRD